LLNAAVANCLNINLYCCCVTPRCIFASGSFTEPISVELKLINPSKKRLSYKIKTTSPKAYTVRPASGTVGPNGKTVVIGKSLVQQLFNSYYTLTFIITALTVLSFIISQVALYQYSRV